MARYVIERDECVTFCEERHPVRLGRNPRHYASEPSERRIAIDLGRKGYLCPGGEEHLYPIWTVHDADDDRASNVDSFDVYREAVACRDRMNAATVTS